MLQCSACVTGQMPAKVAGEIVISWVWKCAKQVGKALGLYVSNTCGIGKENMEIL